jgi:hypothetical protein
MTNFKICTPQTINQEELIRKDEIYGAYNTHGENKKQF